MQEIYYNTNYGFGNYNAMTIAVQKRLSHGLQMQSSYIYARNLSNLEGNPASPAGGFAGEYGGHISNPYQPGIDYGNVNFTRRNRFLTTFLYDLPFGKGKMLLNGANGLVDRVVGGWELAGVLLFQSGPFMTVSHTQRSLWLRLQRLLLHRRPGGHGFRRQSVRGAIDRPVDQSRCFRSPPNAIGRFGDSEAGGVVGPGTEAVSMSLIKSIPIKESVRAQIGVQVANLFNHPNFAPPSNPYGGGCGIRVAHRSANGRRSRAAANPVDRAHHVLIGSDT